MSEAPSLHLSWDYGVYQILAVLAFVPALGLAILRLLVVPSSLTIWHLGYLIISVFAGIQIIAYTYQLKRGKDPWLGKWVSWRISPQTPPDKRHRFILASLLIELATGLQISWFPSLGGGVDWLGWLSLIVLIVALVIGGSAFARPDNRPSAHPRASKSEDEALRVERQREWNVWFLIIMFFLFFFYIMFFRPPPI